MSSGKLLSADVLRAILREEVQEENPEILRTDYRCLNVKGMNFLSDIFEVVLTYRGEKSESESINFIVKVEPSEGQTAKEFVARRDCFGTELRMLKDILPRMQALVGRQFGSRLIYGCAERKIIAMENLRPQGFRVKDRIQGLSMDHCSMALRLLAKFHAATVKLCEKDSAFAKSFKFGAMSEKCPDDFLKMVDVGLLRIIEVVGEDVSPKIVDKIRKLSSSFMDRLFRVCDREPGEFCVLNHGDFFINNIMFKEDEEGKPTDVMLIDYQMSVYSSPAIDLLHFLHLSPDLSFRYEKEDYFISFYLEALISAMKSLGCRTSPPTIVELQESIYRRRVYAVVAGLVFQPKLLADEQDITGDYLTANENVTLDTVSTPRIAELMRKLVPIFDERGYFDY